MDLIYCGFDLVSYLLRVGFVDLRFRELVVCVDFGVLSVEFRCLGLV